MSDEEKQSNPSQDDSQIVLIIDVMANLRKLYTKSYKTFGELGLAFVAYIEKSFKNIKRIDFVFDSYLEFSVKDSERKRRQSKQPVELHAISDTTPLPVDMESFWASNTNKKKLEIFVMQ